MASDRIERLDKRFGRDRTRPGVWTGDLDAPGRSDSRFGCIGAAGQQIWTRWGGRNADLERVPHGSVPRLEEYVPRPHTNELWQSQASQASTVDIRVWIGYPTSILDQKAFASRQRWFDHATNSIKNAKIINGGQGPDTKFLGKELKCSRLYFRA